MDHHEVQTPGEGQKREDQGRLLALQTSNAQRHSEATAVLRRPSLHSLAFPTWVLNYLLKGNNCNLAAATKNAADMPSRLLFSSRKDITPCLIRYESCHAGKGHGAWT